MSKMTTTEKAIYKRRLWIIKHYKLTEAIKQKRPHEMMMFEDYKRKKQRMINIKGVGKSKTT